MWNLHWKYRLKQIEREKMSWFLIWNELIYRNSWSYIKLCEKRKRIGKETMIDHVQQLGAGKPKINHSLIWFDFSYYFRVQTLGKCCVWLSSWQRIVWRQILPCNRNLKTSYEDFKSQRMGSNPKIHSRLIVQNLPESLKVRTKIKEICLFFV